MKTTASQLPRDRVAEGDREGDRKRLNLAMWRRKRLLFVAAFCAMVGSVSASAMEFKPYGRGSFAELRKAHTGRPLLAHFWSVTCAPCLAELPEWAKIAQQSKAFDVVFINTDRDNDRPRAEMRLTKAGLMQATHYGFADDFVERLYFEADPSWLGELPFTALVSAAGNVTTVIGAIDDPLIGGWLEKGK